MSSSAALSTHKLTWTARKRSGGRHMGCPNCAQATATPVGRASSRQRLPGPCGGGLHSTHRGRKLSCSCLRGRLPSDTPAPDSNCTAHEARHVTTYTCPGTSDGHYNRVGRVSQSTWRVGVAGLWPRSSGCEQPLLLEASSAAAPLSRLRLASLLTGYAVKQRNEEDRIDKGRRWCKQGMR